MKCGNKMNINHISKSEWDISSKLWLVSATESENTHQSVLWLYMLYALSLAKAQ
jgi:hypothetical protein